MKSVEICVVTEWDFHIQRSKIRILPPDIPYFVGKFRLVIKLTTISIYFLGPKKVPPIFLAQLVPDG